MSTIILPTKAITSDIFIDFNFISMLAPGETIGAASVVSTVHSGVDPSPQAIVSGAATVVGPVVSQKIIDGLVGVIYLLTCTVTTSLSNTIVLQGYLAVLDNDPYQS